MFGSNTSLKPVGVKQPDGQPGNQATPKKLTNIDKAEFYAIRFGDDNGTAHSAVIMKAGDAFYMPPNAEQWAQTLKPLAPWLAKQVGAHIKSAQESLPKEDTVDVMGES